jgi:hypothetical protein
MAQLTEPLVRDILNGAGCTRWEIEQLCHHYLAARQNEALYAAAKSLVKCVEGSGCLVWREATQGIRLKDTQEWVALYLAVKRAGTTPQPAQADTTPAAHGVEKDDGTSDYAVRQFGYWNREATERRRRDSVDSFDAYHEELRKRQAASAPGGCDADPT